jgi:hypothetical protein
VTDAKEAEKKVKKAAKEARNIGSAAREAEGAATGLKKRGRKRKSAASEAGAATPKAKMARISQAQIAEGGQDLSAPKPSAKTASRNKGLEPPSSTAIQGGDGAALES